MLGMNNEILRRIYTYLDSESRESTFVIDVVPSSLATALVIVETGKNFGRWNTVNSLEDSPWTELARSGRLCSFSVRRRSVPGSACVAALKMLMDYAG